MAKPRKSAVPRSTVPHPAAPRKRSPAKKGWSKLVEELEKLAAALERDATHKLGHHFGELTAGLGEFALSSEKPE